MPITAAGVGLTILTVAGVAGLEIENRFSRKLNARHPVRRAVDVFEKRLGGSTELEILVDAGAPDGIADPKVIAAMRQLQHELSKDPRVAHARSIVDLLERMHATLAPEHAASAPTPSTRAQIAQYLLLFEMSGGEDLEMLIDDTGRHARVVVRAADMAAEEVAALAADADALAARRMPAPVTARASGIGVLVGRMGSRLSRTSMTGFAAAMALIAIIIAALFRSARVGLLSLIPNVLPVALGVVVVSVTFGIVDADTLTFTAICIGIAVDDTIHFLARYRIERRKGLGRDAAVDATLQEAGHGIVRTSVILVAGFLSFAIADYQAVVALGVQLPTALAAAVVLDITLVPAMARLGLLDPR